MEWGLAKMTLVLQHKVVFNIGRFGDGGPLGAFLWILQIICGGNYGVWLGPQAWNLEAVNSVVVASLLYHTLEGLISLMADVVLLRNLAEDFGLPHGMAECGVINLGFL